MVMTIIVKKINIHDMGEEAPDSLIQLLTEEERVLVFLRYSRGFTCHEISIHFNVPNEVTERILKRASLTIFTELKEHDS